MLPSTTTGNVVDGLDISTFGGIVNTGDDDGDGDNHHYTKLKNAEEHIIRASSSGKISRNSHRNLPI